MSWGTVYLHRQRHPRVSINLPVEYDAERAHVTASKDAGVPIKATESRNISEGGLLLILKDKLPLDSILSLRIHIPIKYYANRTRISPIQAIARVVWTDLLADRSSEEYHCGVCFTEIAPEDLGLVKEFINRCLTSESHLR